MRAGFECLGRRSKLRREAARSTQVALLAVRADGAVGAAAIQGGFQAAVARGGTVALYEIPGHAG